MLGGRANPTPAPRVVRLITGSRLKNVPAAARAVAIPEPVEPQLDAIAREFQVLA